ncbi:MAG: Eco57I restriction-modification methylase domain-containing protein [Salinibacterium sp.]|nr:Eco57I restriction-modification methylase domain-containing protein [Salinibacterium sp.]MBF0673180.1 Eco57I restriction-modification methylase domain-containing protein [Salinibacterium sp.]
MTISIDRPPHASLVPSAAERSYGAEEKKRGAIFTKQSVVDFMLDLIGYTTDSDLVDRAILEPSFGGGRFVLSVVDRLLDSWRSRGGEDAGDLLNSLRAVELDTDTYLAFRSTLADHLVSRDVPFNDVVRLVDAWLVHGDYLLTDLGMHFDFVIGNPPYVRQELIEPSLLAEYRRSFSSMVGRADLYVAFMERSLDYLNEDGSLSFICADAWLKNDYGRGIRAKISQSFHLACYVDMYGLDAFEVQVGAYPSITLIQRSSALRTRVVRAEALDANYLRGLSEELAAPELSPGIQSINAVRGSQPWLVNANPALQIIHDFEDRFPTLQEAGCRVGIGVATGNDRAFIADYESFDVESDRLLPLATNKCVVEGEVTWTGKGILNPFTDEGTLVDLGSYPKLASHFEQHREALAKRHTAKSNVAKRWYRTIDRITPSLTWEPKLLIPDIRGNGDAIAYDPGHLYPHHNLYFITAERWNLRALQSLLRSGIAHMFVEAYSVKIGGGYLRFQAQNLKRIRIPLWEDISELDKQEMIDHGEAGTKLPISLLERIYELSPGSLEFLTEKKVATA